MTITTNNIPRPIINAWELTEKEQKEFDYLNWDAICDGADNREFFRYRGELYDLNEFERTTCDELKKWHGYQSDSYFSGLVVRYVNDNEQIIVGRYSS